jgi:hypothetical protein
MKHMMIGKTAAVAVVTSLLAGVAMTPAQARQTKVVDGVVYVHPTLKGAEGAGWVRARTQDTLERRESVAGFRVETDAQGRQWVYKHPTLKGAVGAGWVRVPLKGAK